MDQTLSAVRDPARASAMVAEALAEPSVIIPKPPVALDPPDNIVKLPGGSLTADGELVREAEVRELNGFDEEILARVPVDQPGRMFTSILRQGVVRIGNEQATTAMLDNLLMGDRETLLMAIRIATWGDELTFSTTCMNCSEGFDVKLELSKDVPIKSINSDDRNFTVKLRKDRSARMHLPDGHAQTALLAIGIDGNAASINTALLTACVDSIDELPVLGTQPIQRLSVRDRNTLLSELTERTFGPQLGEVKVPCSECGNSIPLPLSLGILFPF